jgi:hypothetical protein
MKQVVSCIVAFLLHIPLAVAQAPSDDYVPDEPEVPMIDLPPEQLPQPDMVWDAEQLGGGFRPYGAAPTEVPAEPQAPLKPQPPPPEIDQSNLPPGYIARGKCWPAEEEVENGAAIFGVPPLKFHQDGQLKDWYPKVCRQKAEAPQPQPPPAWIDESKLPPGYVARAVRCDEGEEEIENAAALFGIEPVKIRWGDQWVDWLPRICRPRGGVQ